MENDATAPNLIVAPHLYLCSRLATQDRAVLEAHKITHVLNVTERAGNQWEGIKYLQIQATDGTRFDLAAHFAQAHAFINEAKESGAAVLVHCEYGISRSATVVIAWLIKHHGMTLKEAFEHTKAQRRVIMPNEGFLKQLSDFEKEVHGKTTLRLGRWGQIEWI